MSDRHEIELTGCMPEPLMSYLKSLGIFRLVSEQADPEATACWRNDVFVLRSKVDRDELVSFFLTQYQPTPVLAPWNAGCGFYKKWDPTKSVFKSREVVEAVENIENSTSIAFDRYRNQIRRTKNTLEERAQRVDLASELDAIREQGELENWSANKIKEEIKRYLDNALLLEVDGHQVRIEKADKDEFVRMMRGEVLDDEAVRWLDAALVLLTGQKKNRIEAPLLGSGGNIGNSDFSARFMQLLIDVLPLHENNSLPEKSTTLLRGAVLGDDVFGLLDYSVDQFHPGIAGGANMGQEMEAKPILNPWDYILMIEGSLLMGGAATRRLDAKRLGSSFPFSVDSTPVGFASAGADETRGELWLPVWTRFCKLSELSTLLAEGRAEIGSRRPRDGVEFARAVTSLGVDRGIHQFVRLQFQKRFGDNYLATALDRFDVRYQQHVHLLQEIDRWLCRYRDACSGDKPKTPPRFVRGLRRIESAVFDYCRHGRREEMQGVLIALGQAERELALRAGHVKKDKSCIPLGGLSAQWVQATHDGTPEFDIALALAGIYDRTREARRNIGPIRCNLETVAVRYGRVTWITDDKHQDRDEQSKRHVVWNSADLTSNLTAVLGRRMMDGARAGCDGLPLDFKRGVSLNMIATFIAGEVDDHRIERLLWGLMLIDHPPPYPQSLTRAKIEYVPPLPREYALLKLLFLPRPLARHWDDNKRRWKFRLARESDEGMTIRLEPCILPLLRAGRGAEACRIAYQRLRASGFKPMPGPKPSGVWREVDWEPDLSLDPHRLAAALLVPVGDAVVNQLIHLVTRQDEEPDTESLVTKGAVES